jgi:hypothetical protein
MMALAVLAIFLSASAMVSQTQQLVWVWVILTEMVRVKARVEKASQVRVKVAIQVILATLVRAEKVVKEEKAARAVKVVVKAAMVARNREELINGY